MQWIKCSSRAFLGALVALFLTAGTGAAQTDVAKGERIFLKNCALCHGGDATGGRGPDLSRGFFRNATTDEQLIEIVKDGIDYTGMPWTGLSDQKARQVVAFIRSLGAETGPIPGDPANGRDLFFGMATCSACHMVGGEGGRQGPDLSWVGWRRALDYLRVALLDPSADVEPRWWTAHAVTTSGSEISGVLIDEDQFAVRLLSENDELHALAKRDLARSSGRRLRRCRCSAMP